MKRLAIIIVLLSNTIFLSGQWEWQRPKPQGNNLYDIFFLDENCGWAVGRAGTVIKSTDRGQSWEAVENSIRNQLFCVWFADTLNGWSIRTESEWDYTGLLMHTNDGGKTWEDQFIDSLASTRGLLFFDSKHGWAYGTTCYYTSDGGTNWQERNNGISEHYNIQSLHFIDTLNGWAVIPYSDPDYHSAIVHTTDGGKNWITILDSTYYINKIQFINELDGWAMGSNILLRTNDGGNSWIDYEVTQGSPIDMHFVNENVGWVIGSEGLYYFRIHFILKTVDGGESWSVQEENLMYKDLTSIYGIDENNVHIAGSAGLLLKTTDGGENWESFDDNSINWLECIDFIDFEKGWASGGGDILHTSNSGIDWEVQYTNSDYSINSICFIDENNGWAGGKPGLMLSTSDGGQNWGLQDSIIGTINSVHFVDQNHGWAVGKGSIINTTDGGINWELQLDNVYVKLNDVFFTDMNTGWAVEGYGSNPFPGKIIHTDNGGETWEIQLEVDTAAINAIYFINSENGYAVGYAGAIYKTSDGGESWQGMKYPMYGTLYDVYFTDENNGWIVGGYAIGGTSFMGSIVLYTKDGGESWNEMDICTNNLLRSVDFVDQNNGWVAGAYNSILHIDNGVTVDVNHRDFKEHGNLHTRIYPNPFTTSTTIEYEIVQPQTVRITFYNQFGKQVDIIRQDQSQGLNKVIWTPESLADGVYYFRLEAGERMATGKVVLMK